MKKSNYIPKFKWLLFNILIAILAMEANAGTPQKILVTNITNPTAANGVYVKQTGTAGSAGMEYWKHETENYFLYCDDYAAEYYWNLDDDLNDENNAYFYADLYTQDLNFAKTTYPSPDIVGRMTSWTEDLGSGIMGTINVSAVAAVPEINILGNSISIVKGDITPSLTDHTDFGPVAVAGSSIARTFTVQNTGTANLTISGVAITGANASDFTITTAPASSVAAAGSTTFQISFNPSAIGLRSATMTVNNNDTDEGTYDFTIQGTGYDLAAVTTTAATPITATAATLNGSVNANNASTVVSFEYGTTTSYGTTVTATQSPVTGTSDTSVSYALTGLDSNTTYHFRVNGVNAAGTTNGADQTFTTLQSPAVAVAGSLHSFAYCAGSNSEVQSFTVSGINVAADMIITAPAGFEVSATSVAGFGGTLTLSGGTIASTTVFVRVSTSASGTLSGNIAVAATGITTQNVPVSRFTSGGAYYAEGNTFTILLGCSSVVTVASTGTAYTFTLQAGNSWIGSGTATGALFATNILTVSTEEPSAYDTFEILDAAAGAAVTFANSGVNTYNDNFIVTLDNLAGVTTFNGNSSFSGNNGISITTDATIKFNSGSGLTTSNGSIILSANQQDISTALAYPGIDLDNSVVQSTGTGTVTLNGKSGKGGQFGIRAKNGSRIKGGTTGILTIEGKGDNTLAGSYGVCLDGGTSAILSTITSIGADVFVSGTGGNISPGGNVNAGNNNIGVVVQNGGIITSGGNGTVTVNGYGNPNTSGNNGNFGVVVYNNDLNATNISTITSGGTGKVTVKGVGGASGNLGGYQSGVYIYNKSILTSGKGGSVEVTGNGGVASPGANNYGIFVGLATISCGPGNGGGNITSGFNYGVYMAGSGLITAGGSGVVNVTGNGGGIATGSTGGYNSGIYLSGTGNQITSGGGDVFVTGKAGGDPKTGFGLSSTGSITTLANGGNITLTSNSMFFGPGSAITANSANSLNLLQ